MSPEESFLFDLNGLVVVRGLLSPTEVAELNVAIDAHDKYSRDDPELKNANVFSAEGSRIDMGGMLSWETPAFRRLLAHHKLVPYLNALCGPGYRLDHHPMVILQKRHSEGFDLHGGPMTAGKFNPELQYRYSNGSMWNSLLAMAVCLCRTTSQDGGFVALRGSHKCNMPMPENFASAYFAEHMYHPETEPGDVIFFSEATIHGAIPWRGDHERRLALYRFSPGNMAYGRGYMDGFAGGIDHCNEAEASVLVGPHANRLERAQLVCDGENVVVKKTARSEAKKKHDRNCFGSEYF